MCGCWKSRIILQIGQTLCVRPFLGADSDSDQPAQFRDIDDSIRWKQSEHQHTHLVPPGSDGPGCLFSGITHRPESVMVGWAQSSFFPLCQCFFDSSEVNAWCESFVRVLMCYLFCCPKSQEQSSSGTVKIEQWVPPLCGWWWRFIRGDRENSYVYGWWWNSSRILHSTRIVLFDKDSDNRVREGCDNSGDRQRRPV